MSRNLFFLISILFSIYFLVFSIIVTKVAVPLEIVGTVIALFSLYLGGDSFVDNARELGKRRKISSKSIGAYLLSLGAVIDEFSVIFVASYHGYGDISFGTLQGSNIVTLAVFLIILPFAFSGTYRRFLRDGLILLVSSVLLLLLAFIYPIIPWYIGVAMAGVFLIYMYTGRGGAPPIEEEYVHMEYSPLSILVALVLLALASEAIVNYTNGLSLSFNIPPFLSGFIITGFAGSLPEIIMFFLGIKKGDRDVTLGIVTGSTLYKATLIMGATMLFGIIDLRVSYWSIYFMIMLSAVFMVFTMVTIRRKVAILPLLAISIFTVAYFII